MWRDDANDAGKLCSFSTTSVDDLLFPLFSISPREKEEESPSSASLDQPQDLGTERRRMGRSFVPIADDIYVARLRPPTSSAVPFIEKCLANPATEFRGCCPSQLAYRGSVQWSCVRTADFLDSARSTPVT